MVRNVNKLSALRTDPVCFSFRFLLELAEVIFSSKSLKKSLIKMFPFNFQLSDDFCEVFRQKSRIGFPVGRFLCLLKHLRTFAPKKFPRTDFLKIWLPVENDKIRLKTYKKSGVTELVLKIRRTTDHSISRISSHSRQIWADSLLSAYI